MVNFRDVATNALAYWEPRRILYNSILLIVTLTWFPWGQYTPFHYGTFSVASIVVLAIFAVLANLFYCFAYVVDVFVQLSGLRERWLSWRRYLFALGVVFGALLAAWATRAFFYPSWIG